MGRVSQKLRNRFRKLLSGAKMSSSSASPTSFVPNFAEVGTVEGVKDVVTLIQEGRDPIHSIYIHVQHLASFCAEHLSELPELREYRKIAGDAEEKYLPQGPPISPLTITYFTTWAFFDLRFGPDKETLGTCMIDLADVLGFDDRLKEAFQAFQKSRMGIYEHRGVFGGRVRLRELISDREVVCYCVSGYGGRPGELWYVRLCPPLWDLGAYWITVTTPYVLLGMSKNDWIAYLRRAMLQVESDNAEAKLEHLMKYGLNTHHWNEYILRAYVDHQHDAVFLTGLPDVKGSLPHA